MADGQAATVALSGAHRAILELYAADGVTLLATGRPSGDSVGIAISGFVDTTSDNAADRYYLRVSGASGEYRLVALKEGKLNSFSGLAPDPMPLRSGETALGYVDADVSLETPLVAPFDVVGSPLSVGFAVDGSFSGPGVGISHGGVEIVNRGTFLAGYSVAFNGQTFANNSPVSSPSFPVAIYDISQANHHAYRIQGEISPGVTFQRTVQWTDGDDFMHVTTTIDNQSGAVLSGLAFLENIDPDPSSTTSSTSNDVTSAGTLVVASAGGKSIGLGSNDPDVVVSAEGFTITNPFVVIDSPADPGGVSDDIAINLAFNIGNLPSGAAVTRDFQIVFGSSQSDVESLFATIGAPPIPRLELRPDVYTFKAIAGDAVQIRTYTPGAGPYEFLNDLDAAVEVIAPDGSVVPHVNAAGDETLSFAASQTGAYTLRLFGESETVGDYAVEVTGTTAAPDPFEVVASSAVDGDTFLPGGLTTFTVDLDADLRLDSVATSDLLIDGFGAATGLTVVDPNILSFALPALADGVHTLELAAGSLVALDGRPLEGFSIAVVVDGQGPRIVGTSVVEGESRPPDFRTFTFVVDEPLDQSALTPSGVSLVGSRTGSQPIESVTFDVATLSLTVTTTANLPEDAFVLRLIDSAFVDVLGLELDGEADPVTTIPSGDGVPGGDFVVNFSVDTVTSPLVDFTPRGLAGGLVYEASASGYISPAGDIDAFEVDLDVGQAISVVIDGEISALVELFGPNGESLAVATAAAAGEAAVLQSLPVGVSGTYRIEVAGDSDTTGGFTLHALLNAQPEREELGGADNASPAQAETLDFTPLASGRFGVLSEHAAVTGLVSSVGPTYMASLTDLGRAFAPNILTFDFVQTPTPVGDVVVTVNTEADLGSTTEFFTVDAEGLFSQVLFASGGSEGGLSTAQFTIPAATAALLAADGTITLTVTPSTAVNSGIGPGNVTIDVAYAVAGVLGDDWYRFELADGQAATAALVGAEGVTAELYAADGVTLIASGTPSVDGGWFFENYVDRTSDGALEDYFLRVAGTGQYDIVLTRDAALDRGSNDSFETAQDVGGLAGVLGAVVGPDQEGVGGDDDWYLVTLNAGDTLSASVSLPGGGAGEFNNPLATGLPGGVIISEVVDGAIADGNPKFVEITNTNSAPFTFTAGGLIVQTNANTDRTVDIDLTGVTIGAGASLMIASSANGGRAVFESVYGFAADVYADELIGDGNDRYAVTDAADGSSILDLYGPFGVDGAGSPWEYTDAYAYRLPGAISPTGEAFQVGQWYVATPGALDDGSDSPAALLLAKTTPGAHQFVPSDSPLARVALFDPSGTQVVSDGTSLLYSAAEAGAYRLRVSALGLAGEYYVSLTGATGGARAPEIVATSPADGELLNALPSAIDLVFSEPLLAGEVEASDLLLNGVAGALSVIQIDSLTYRFEIDPSAALGDGAFTVTLPAGAVTDLQGLANADQTFTFEIDNTPPIVQAARIDGLSLPLGVTYLNGDHAISATFSEPIDESLLTFDSFRLVETVSGSSVAAEAFSYDSASQTFTVDYTALDEGAYEFTLVAGSFVDAVGNVLDGEPLGTPLDGAPSGDGIPGGDYTLGFQIDSAGVRTIADFTRLEPLGGLVFASENNAGILNGPGDFDDFVLSLAAGEVIAVTVTPTDPTATLNVSAVGLSGPITAPVAGAAAVLQAVAMPIDSPLTLRVVGDKPTSYRLDVFLNTSLDLGPLDSGLSNPLAIDGSLVSLPESRYAVLGQAAPTPSRSTIYTEDFNLGRGGFIVNNNFGAGAGLWDLSTGRQLDGLPNHSAPNSLYFGQNTGPFGGGDYNSGVPVEGVVTSPTIAIPDTGGAWLTFNHLIETDRLNDVAEVAVVSGGVVTPILLTTNGTLASDTAGDWRTVSVDLSQFAGRSIQLRFRFDSVDAVANNYEGWFIDDLRVEAAGASIADLDEFTLPVVGGVPIDVVLASQENADFAGVTLQIVDPMSGVVLASGVAAPSGEVVENYDFGVLGYTPAQDGVIGVRVVSQQAGRYSVVVTAGAVFEAEPNGSSASPSVRELAVGGSGLGFLGFEPSGGDRLYAVNVNSSAVVEIDPQTGEPIATIPLPEAPTGGPDGLAMGGGSLFYSEGDFGVGSTLLYEIDPATGEVLDTDSFASMGLPTTVDSLAYYGGRLVVIDTIEARAYFVDTVTDTVVGSFLLPVSVRGGAAGAATRGSIFVNDFLSNGFIYEVDVATGTAVNSFSSPSSSAYGLAYVAGSLYVSAYSSGVIYRLDPDTGALLDTFAVGFAVSALGGDDGSGVAPFGFVPPIAVGPGATPETGAAGPYYDPTPGLIPDLTATPQAEFLGAAANQDDLGKKIGADLAAIYRETLGLDLAAHANASSSGARNLVEIQDGWVLVDAFAEEDGLELLTRLEDLGMQGGSVYSRTVSGWMPVEALGGMAELTAMRFARASYRPMTNVGRTTSQGDRSMGSDAARSLFGVDGAGVTIGVLSDSFGSGASDVAFGDLPGVGNPFGNTTPVNVLSDTSGTGEGRAMAQLVHDVAPGAALAFHTAFNGQADFANGILELQSVAGADVIVDDVIYFAEPMFQDGVIAQAIDTVVANGATYFSSAGNNGRDSWDDAFRGSGESRFGAELHDFDPGPGVDTLQGITVPVGSSFILSFQWDSPFFSVSGGAGTQNDLDVYVLNSTGTSVLASSTTRNLGGDALEVMNFTNTSGSSSLNIAIGLAGGAAPGLMKWVSFDTLTVDEYASNSATAYGHANAAGAMAIGAADYRATPAFGASAPSLESFSSAGGIPTLFDLAGNRINELRSKPNLVAPDGTNTTFFGSDVDGDGFPNFFGTSAAAPHAAAVAALMKQLSPLATPAEVYDALALSAIDMDDPSTVGFDVGFDDATGPGFIDSVGALTLVSVDPALQGPRVTAISPAAGVTTDLSLTELTLEFSEVLDATAASNAANFSLLGAGFDGVFQDGAGDDVVLALVPLYDGATTVTLAVGDGSTPLRTGRYRLRVDDGVVDPEGNPLNSLDGPGLGAATIHEFEVVLQLPSGGDYYEITLEAGQGILLETALPRLGPSAPANTLDPQITVYDPFGVLVGTDQDSADGVNASLGFVANVSGVYIVQATAESGAGEYVLRTTPADFVLAADFNRDGKVNAADYSLWRDSLGSVVGAPYTSGDANGDAVIDSNDYDVWVASYGATLGTATPDQLIRLESVPPSVALASEPIDPIEDAAMADAVATNAVAIPSPVPLVADSSTAASSAQSDPTNDADSGVRQRSFVVAPQREPFLSRPVAQSSVALTTPLTRQTALLLLNQSQDFDFADSVSDEGLTGDRPEAVAEESYVESIDEALERMFA
ncbi:Bacillopeptidase F precursor [Botrimarina colliarenosi]|uniref:Bacillopeptidase F n=1 Tax=Botrimarina colliarenosi TaxID=2528001 RepID=A0A5C5ZZ92_9BACT|nr:Ig-like domain-containing protein [Botrimarina colliarenosi]TWT92884.1 Bacillopeptidase F precursor [Botrimarina colliarenosi]